MADKPILFSGSMVRALLAGTKTQTRRLMPHQEWLQQAYAPIVIGARIFNYSAEEEVSRARWNVGDRLYVREHWRTFISLDKVAPRDLWAPDCGKGAGILYIADSSGMSLTAQGERFYGPREGDAEAFGKHRQAMHMPRWASRLTLTVTDVRVQRLQGIDVADAFAEGLEKLSHTLDAAGNSVPRGKPLAANDGWGSNGEGSYSQHGWDDPVGVYADLWEHINGVGSWEANPWVAAYTFTVEHGNIDQVKP